MELKKDQIQKNLIEIRKNIELACKKHNRNSDEVSLIAVSKTHPLESIIYTIEKKQRLFGESYAQEFKSKAELAEQQNLDIEWHFIGHLQTNKVKYVVPFAHTIHSVDSIKLAEEIQKQCVRFDKKMKMLIQINTSGEATKSGVNTEADLFALYDEISKLDRLEVIGLMTIAGLSESKNETIKEFQKMNLLLKNLSQYSGKNINQLSMGMTGDYAEAIEYGATYIRIGTAIFGERDYV